MTSRDRTTLLVLATIALLGGFWFFALKPKRADAEAVQGKIVTEQQRLQTAQATVAQGLAAKAGYARDYATVAQLGKAVPADDDLTSLLYQLDTTSRGAHVTFGSLTRNAAGAAAGSGPAPAAAAGASQSGSTSSSSSPSAGAAAPTASTPTATQSAAAALPPGATVGTAGLATLPFAFDFTGSFFQLEHFLTDVQRYVRSSDGKLAVRGRLLTIDGISLVPGSDGLSNLRAKLSATAYLMPATQTPAGTAPAGTPGAAGAPGATAPATAAAPTSSAITAGATR